MRQVPLPAYLVCELDQTFALRQRQKIIFIDRAHVDMEPSCSLASCKGGDDRRCSNKHNSDAERTAPFVRGNLNNAGSVTRHSRPW